MYLPKKHKTLFYSVFFILVLLITGNTSLKQHLPPSVQEVFFTNTPTTHAVKGLSTSNTVQRQTAKVVRVVDGDTIVLDTGQKLRYIGMNTPESVDPRRPVQCFGKEASERNKALVLNKTIALEKDVSETDKYGRLLRYVYVENTMIDEELVREGFAYATAYPPDVKYQEQLKEAEYDAKIHNR